MNLALLLPLGLVALTALLVPLLVHLARRSEERMVSFAALRWLQSRPQPRRKRRFDEYLLLFMRLLLLAALALLLAEPVLYGQTDRRPWTVVMPGVDTAALPSAEPDARLHWLAAGFPRIELADTAADVLPEAEASPSSLLRQLDAELPAGTPLTVVVPEAMDGVDAERPRLSRPVNWQTVAAAPAPAIAPPAVKPMRLMVRHAPQSTAALRYLRAAGSAWQVTGAPGEGAAPAMAEPAEAVQVAPSTEPLDQSQRNLVWLAPGPLPQGVEDWIARGGIALLDAQVPMPALDSAGVLWRDAAGPLVRGARFGKGRVMRLERDLLPARMPVLLEPDFPERLRALFVPEQPPPARVWAQDHSPRTGLAPYPETPRPLAPWLVLLVALLFLVERWVANGPRRRQAA